LTLRQRNQSGCQKHDGEFFHGVPRNGLVNEMKRRDHIIDLRGLETGMGAQRRPALLQKRNQMLVYDLNEL
jgi:hypothetical protein